MALTGEAKVAQEAKEAADAELNVLKAEKDAAYQAW
jgi:hypothetical protein